MKILHISAANSAAGAGIACVRLHKSLLQRGLNSRILFLTADGAHIQKSDFYSDSYLRKAKRLFLSFADRSLLFIYPNKTNELFSPGLFGVDIESHPLVKQADIIHLHWVNHAFVDISRLKGLNKPIIWTMHDCWPFTGGCHYFFDCDGFERSCGNCPVLNSGQSKDLSSFMFRRKKSVYKSLNIKFIAISSWMKNNAGKGLLAGKDIEVIPSGIDCSIFKWKDGASARPEFGIRNDEKVILLGAQHLQSRSKGMSLSIEALNAYEEGALTVVTFGGGKLELQNQMHRILNLGYISDKKIMADIYKMSDVFICTSIAEGFGMTVAEAQCSGTPAIAFRNTGPSDIVVHHNTGYLAEFMNVDDVLEGLRFCLTASFDRIRISRNSISKFSIDVCAVQYEEIFNQTLNDETSNSI
ncbi:glycosyltransferase [Pedobacter duraquae]|uniref:Glycosyltransferase involved in cell wall biosynthesis n=1 Tax=Pedobacter duraquae TaxID=425511 RepID=A0A4R6IJ00_9SPHI|nr:glycosyltransferase [Pedobacter duraquae]TDO21974.1 glycosyltransferase involved in cell wall biosynthesis [Pedobacter duraquae]